MHSCLCQTIPSTWFLFQVEGLLRLTTLGNASPTIKSLAANVQGHTWNSLDLIETLCRIGDVENSDVRQRVREMLDKAVKISAELVHMGLLQVPVSRYE